MLIVQDLEGIALAAGAIKSPQRMPRPLNGEFELIKAEKTDVRSC